VWAKLPALRAACAVEVAIDGELRALSMQATAQVRRKEHATALAVSRRARFASRLPSWLDLGSLGLPNVASVDDIEAFSSKGASMASLEALAEGKGEREEVVDEEERQGESGGGGGREDVGIPYRLESGMDAWRDITALAMGANDIMAP